MKIVQSAGARHNFVKIVLLFIGLLVTLALAEAVLRLLDLADPPVFEAKPHYEYLMRPNQSVSTRGYRFHINNIGFRGYDISIPKAKDTFRIVFLGDSVTYGGGNIPGKYLFVNLVTSSLNSSEHRQTEGINLSVPGWGIQNIAAYVATKGLLEADLLIWVIPAIDFRRPKASLKEHRFPVRTPWSRSTYAAAWVLHRIPLLLPPRRTGLHGTLATLERNVQTFHRTLTQITKSKAIWVVVLVPSAHESEHFPEDAWRSDEEHGGPSQSGAEDRQTYNSTPKSKRRKLAMTE